MHHRSRRRYEPRLADMMACFLVIDDFANELHHVFVAGAALHQCREVVFANGEQAGANLAVGGDAHAAAVSAEWMRHGGDDTDLANAVFEGVAVRGLASLLAEVAERHELGHPREYLVKCD